jgi:hypothetical protein
MGAAIGAALSVVLIATNTPIAALCLNSSDPWNAVAVVFSALVAYCSVGATLSGYILMMIEDSQTDA